MDRKHSEEWHSRLARTVNSAVCFSLAYVVLTYLLWFVMGLTGRLYKFDSFIYYYGIKFILNSNTWNVSKVAIVFSSGPFFVLLLGLLGLFLFMRMKEIRTMLNVLFAWTFIIGVSIFISQFVIAALGIYSYNSLYYQGLAVSFAWLKVPVFLIYLLNALLIIPIIYLGVNCSRLFLVFSYSYAKVNNLSGRRKYFFEIAVAPFIVGSLVTIVAVFPKELSAKGILILLASTHIIYLAVIGMILGIGWLSLSYIEIVKQELVRYKSLQALNIVFIIFMLLSWAFISITFRGVYISA